MPIKSKGRFNFLKVRHVKNFKNILPLLKWCPGQSPTLPTPYPGPVDNCQTQAGGPEPLTQRQNTTKSSTST